MLTQIRESWRAAFAERNFKISFFVILGSLVVVMLSFARFIEFVEGRTGSAIDDPILRWFTPADFTWVIFSMIYIALPMAIFMLARDAKRLVRALLAYMLMILIRIVCMYSIPLEPPELMIPLADPFVEFFADSDFIPTKDLFFSGHTATMSLLFFTAIHRPIKTMLGICAVVMAVMVMWQHVHYSVDVVVAPLAAFSAYRLAYFVLPLDRERVAEAD